MDTNRPTTRDDDRDTVTLPTGAPGDLARDGAERAVTPGGLVYRADREADLGTFARRVSGFRDVIPDGRADVETLARPGEALDDPVSPTLAPVAPDPGNPEDAVGPESTGEGADVALAGMRVAEYHGSPTWIEARHGAAYPSGPLRALARAVFSSFPCFADQAADSASRNRDGLGEIRLIANCAGRGPSDVRELRDMVAWMDENGLPTREGSFDFDSLLPGYRPAVVVALSEDTTFLSVVEDAGSGGPYVGDALYVYAWKGGARHYRANPDALARLEALMTHGPTLPAPTPERIGLDDDAGEPDTAHDVPGANDALHVLGDDRRVVDAEAFDVEIREARPPDRVDPGRPPLPGTGRRRGIAHDLRRVGFSTRTGDVGAVMWIERDGVRVEASSVAGALAHAHSLEVIATRDGMEVARCECAAVDEVVEFVRDPEGFVERMEVAYEDVPGVDPFDLRFGT